MATKTGKQSEVRVTDDDDGGRRLPRWGLVGIVVLVAGLLVGGGVLLANWLNRDDTTPVERATDAQALQALVVASSQADQLLAQASGVDATDTQAVQSLGIQIQSAAITVADIGAQVSDEELQDIAEDLSDAYLDIGVGLVTNSETRTQRGVSALPDAQAEFSRYLGIEPSPAPAPTAPADPSPSPTQSPSE
jgi:hypothetical protein